VPQNLHRHPRVHVQRHKQRGTRVAGDRWADMAYAGRVAYRGQTLLVIAGIHAPRISRGRRLPVATSARGIRQRWDKPFLNGGS